MKKIIAIVLLLTLCLGLFAGCDQKPAEPTSNLANAKALLFSKYKPASKDEIPAKSSDFEVVTSILVDGVSYPVEWTVTVTKGAADAVKIVDGSSAAFKKVELPKKPAEAVEFTLTATVKDAAGNSETVSFKYIVPATAAPSEKPVVLYFGKDNKYITGVHYFYADKSKYELTLTDNKAEALAMVVQDNGDDTVSFVAGGKYLFCDATHVKFADEQSDNTKFVLEAADADGGVFIKCAVANYGGKAQYLEVYSGYLTCYGMGSDASIYTFTLQDGEGANGTIVMDEPTEPEKPEEPDVPVVPSTGIVENPEAGKAYKFGMVQAKAGKTVYLIGGMDGFYMATSEDVTKAIDVYLETTEGGYYLYVMVDGAKQYINMVVTTGNDGKTHVNAAYEATASTVYTWDAEHKTVVSNVTVGDKTEPYWHGTRNDKTYTTMGPCAVSYAGFYGQFYTAEGGATPEEPETPVAPSTGIVENPEAGKAYKFGMVQAKAGKTVYLIGGMDGFYMATSEDVTKAIDVYLETTEGGYYLYVMVDGAKQYINMVVTTGNDGKTHVNAAYEATASTVYTWDAEHKTVVSNVTVGDKTEPYWHGTRNDKTYTTMGPCAVSYAGFYGQFYTVENGSAPENPETPDEPETPSKPADATITFDNVANRTVMTEDQQVWVQNGITVTNNKAESTQPVKDYTAPVRFYANTSLKIEFTGMKTIKIYCNSGKPVSGLTDSLAGISGITVTVDGNVVTITFDTAVNSFEIAKLVAQIRVDKIEIYK